MSEIAFHRPRKVTLVEAVIEQITEQIQAGKLKPGDRLPSERQLIESFQIGRSSVREALQGLAMMGVVEIRPGQGTFISRGSRVLMPGIARPGVSAELRREMRLSLCEARRFIECETARRAALNVTGESANRLQEILEAYCGAATRSHDLEAAADPHHAFHIEIARMSGNPFFAPMLDLLLRSVPQSLRRSELNGFETMTAEDILEREIAIHRQICTAVSAGDSQGAAKAMDDHMAIEEQLINLVFESEAD